MAIITEGSPIPKSPTTDYAAQAAEESAAREAAEELTIAGMAAAQAAAREAAVARKAAEAKAIADAAARAQVEQEAAARVRGREQAEREAVAIREEIGIPPPEVIEVVEPSPLPEVIKPEVPLVAPPPAPREGYESITHAGEGYLVKGGVYYRESAGKLHQVMEPSELRTARLYGIDVSKVVEGITPESVTTEGMRPDQILIAMKEAGASETALMTYTVEHPDAVRGVAASQLVSGIIAQFDLPDLSTREGYDRYQGMSDGEKFDALVGLGLIPEGSEFIEGLKVDWSKSDLTLAEIEAREARMTELTGRPAERWAYRPPERVAEMKAAVPMVSLRTEVLSTASGDITITPSELEEFNAILKKTGTITQGDINMVLGRRVGEDLVPIADVQAVLAKLVEFKTDEGYDLVAAFDAGKGADVYAARALGLFTSGRVIAAQFGAIRAASTKSEFEGILKDMPIGYQEAYAEGDIEGYTTFFEANNTQLADGKWIENSKLAELKIKSPVIYAALMEPKTGGFDAADVVVQASIKEFESDVLPNLPKVLQDAYAEGGTEGFSTALEDYNEVMSITKAVFPSEGESYWVSEETAVEAHSDEFADKYAAMVQPASMSDAVYAEIRSFILPGGFDSASAYEARAPIGLINEFVLATSTQEFRDKVASGEIVLLPYGQPIERETLKELPEGVQQIVGKSGLVGLEKVQEITYVNAFSPEHEEVTEAERQKLIEEYDAGKELLIAEGKGSSQEIFDELGRDPNTSFVLSGKSAQRVAVTLASGPFPVIKAALPEYTVGDLSLTDYALTGVNAVLMASLIAPVAIVGSVVGVPAITAVSTTGAAFYGVRLAGNWAELGPVAKVIGVAGVVAYSLPLLASIYKGFVSVHPRSGEILNLELVKGSLPSKGGLTATQKATVTSTVEAGIADLKATGAKSTSFDILGAQFKLEWVKTGTTSALVPIGKVTIPMKTDLLLEHAIQTATAGTGVSAVVVGQTVWKGLKLGTHPLVGVSGGKLVAGVKGIELPPLSDWNIPTLNQKGNVTFEPRTGLETQVLVNQTALEKAGMTGPEATKLVSDVEKTLSEVKSFYGKKSPHMAPELLTESIDTFSSEGVRAIMKWAVENKDVVEYERFFGSFAARPQLSPEAYAEWVEVFGRAPGDIDIVFKEGITTEQAKEAVKDLVKYIGENSGDKPWVNPDKPHLVMNYSRSTGAKRHAIDIHFPGELSTEAVVSPPRFAEMVYGLKKTAPVVKVDIEGIGKIDIARLSEFGVGKTEQVLGWRVDPETGSIVLRPAAHRAKDYPDLYETIKTYAGAEAADRWATELGIQEILSKQAAMVSDAAVLSKAQAGLRNIPDTASLSDIKSGLLDAQSTIYKIKDPEVGSSIQKELDNVIKELDKSMEQGEGSFAIQTKLNNAYSAIDNVLGKYQPKGSDLSWEFKPSLRPSPKTTESVTPIVSIVSPAWLSAYHSIPVGMTSEGSIVSAPYDSGVVPSVPTGVTPLEVSLPVPSKEISPIELLPSPTTITEPVAPISEPPISVPPVSEPEVSVPEVSEPPVSVPEVSVPEVSEPPISEPPISMPPIEEPPISKPPIEEPPISEPPPPPPPTKKPPPILPSPEEQVKEAYRKGLPVLLFRLGELGGKDVWKAVIAPATQVNLLTVVGTEKLPVTPRKYATGEGSAKKTMQWLGKGPGYAGSADIGIADVYWGAEEGEIHFKGGGLKTVAGTRIPSPTKGISIDRAEAPLGLRGLKLGTSLEQLLIGEYGTEALKSFGERALSLHLSKMTPEEIAEEIRDVVLPESRVEEILSHLPSRVGTSVRGLLKRKYAMLPIKAAPSERRQRAMEEEALSEKEMKKKIGRNGRVIPRESLPEVLEVF